MEQILEALANQNLSDKSEEQVDNRDYRIKPLIPNPNKNSVISSNNGNEKTKKEELLTRLTYTLKKLNQYERNIDKNCDVNITQLDAEGIFTQKEVLSQNVEENIKGIIQSVQEYITKLDYQLKDLDDADQQVNIFLELIFYFYLLYISK